MEGIETSGERDTHNPIGSIEEDNTNDFPIRKNKNFKDMTEEELIDEEAALMHLRKELESQITEVNDRLSRIGLEKFNLSKLSKKGLNT